MLTKEELEKVDTQGMFKIYDSWPQLAKKSYFSNLETIDFGKINHIVFAGMGGSGSLGDVFSAILSKTDLHINVVKGYLLPENVNKKTLVITTSVSGNTIETLSILKAAKKIGCKSISFSSGGKIEQYCNKNKMEFRKIKKMHSPRASFIIFLFSMLKILENSISIDSKNIQDCITELEKTCKNICSDNLTASNQAIGIAKALKGIPVIYYPWGLQAAAIRFKSSLQENAKNHAIIEDVVEASHNGIVSWERKSNVTPILLQGKDDYIKTKERWKIFEEYFLSKKIKFKKISSNEGNIISKLVNLIYILDYSSIYFAIINQIDPTPVKSIDYIKKRT